MDECCRLQRVAAPFFAHAALRQLLELASLDERAEQIVRLRFFTGMACAQIAELLGISERTVRTDWSFARSWLFDRMSRDEPK